MVFSFLIKILGHFSFGGNFADDEECFALSTSCSVNVTVLGDLSCLFYTVKPNNFKEKKLVDFAVRNVNEFLVLGIVGKCHYLV